MSSNKKTQNSFISTQDWDKEELDKLLKLAIDMKLNSKKYQNALDGKSMCMFFYNPSTRTRNSTQVAAYQLGMLPTFNSIKDSWIGYKGSESIKDTAIVLGRYYDVIGIRILPNAVDWKYKEGNRIMREFSKWSGVPTINFEDDQFHPLQALTDILTIQEKKKETKGKKIVISWAYHPKALPVSVPNSILLASSKYGMDVSLVHPKNFELDEHIINLAKQNVKTSGGSLDISNDIEEGYDSADVVYVKSWGSLKRYGDAREEKKLRLPYRDSWRIKDEHLDYASQSAIFMHCLPIRRNVVANDSVVDGKHSVVYDQAENRLYTAKALLYYLLKE
jgi:N-acetylornithine carbamoyltransferase